MYGIIAIIVIVTLVLVAYIGIGTDVKWESPLGGTIDGNWGVEVILEYEDGTLQSLKPSLDKPLFSVWNEGKKATGIYYVVNGQATATGYSTVVVHFQSYKLTYTVKSGSTVKRETVSDFGALNIGDKNLPIDGAWHELAKVHHTASALGDGLAVGTYTVSLVPSGSLTYSVDGGSSQIATLPSIISFTVEVKSDQTLSISFSSGYTFG